MCVKNLALGVEVVLQFCLGTAIGVGQVADDLSFLQQGDAGGDVDGVLQVMRGDEDGGARLVVVLCQEVLQDVLRRRVEEVERFVEDNY